MHKPFAFLILDIDRFKHINEALGHSFGDLILQSVASRLTEQLPSHVFVGRLTGDEFAIVYPNLNQEDELISVCKRIQNQINEPLQVENLLLNVSVTIGGALYPNHGNVGDELLKHANMALMEAQQQNVPFKNVSAINGWQSIRSSGFGEPFASCFAKKRTPSGLSTSGRYWNLTNSRVGSVASLASSKLWLNFPVLIYPNCRKHRAYYPNRRMGASDRMQTIKRVARSGAFIPWHRREPVHSPILFARLNRNGARDNA